MVFMSPTIVFGKSALAGGRVGVFAAAPIKAGTVLERCRIIVTKAAAPPGDGLWDYALQSPWDDSESLICLGGGVMYNHGDNPHVKHVHADRRRQTVDVVAVRSVRPGEELLMDYGERFWHFDHGERCLLSSSGGSQSESLGSVRSSSDGIP